MSRTGVSIWIETAPPPEAATLAADERADVCVLGAGIAGLTTAYLLARAGLRVVVLDSQKAIASAETGHTTAHLSCVIDDRFSEVSRIRGEGVLRLAVQGHAEAIRFIERTAAAEHVSCDFRRVEGYLFLSPGDEEKLLDAEEAAARKIGLAFERLPSAPVPAGPTRWCLRFPDQARFHPLKYLAGMLRALVRLGARVYTGAHAEGVEGGPPCKVTLKGGRTVTSEAVVVATNTPINDVVSLHTKQAPYTTYAMSLALGTAAPQDALYWDTQDPYHYVRLQEGNGGEKYLIVGGADHKTGQHVEPHENWGRIERWGREHFPGLGEVAQSWSGQVMETFDGLAFIGPDPGGQKNVFIATGDSGMGMTHGTIAGLLLSELVRGRDHPWAKVYDPSRLPMRTLGEYVRENANVAAQYLDWLTGGDVGSVAQIAPGSGAVVRRGLAKLAVYRDERGEAHVCSATCPHLGCVVHWNDGEKTWDCPCHGSRFSATGEVIHGPAVSDLRPAE
jgi:glycine/D-amino acid oxidase-like deaminating enzyme/nitrite reductase/ring-hydroxylating ferredoxin subunit